MLFLSDEQVRELADVDEVIAAVRAAFARDFPATLRMPQRTMLQLSDGALLLVMPAYDSALRDKNADADAAAAAGVKLVTVSREAGVVASYDLLDPRTGSALAHMEANYLTDLRTAATSAVATDLLANPDVETLGIFGSGRQAAAHLAVLPHVRRFRRFLVFGSGSGRFDLGKFLTAMQAAHGPKMAAIEAIGAGAIEAVDAETCARQSDVICACTTSASPLFDGHWARPGTHLNLVGAFQPHTREVDDITVTRARVVVDLYDAALAEAGDLLIPINNGSIARDHIVADLHEVASGKKHPRRSPQDITLFKSVGCALEDLVAADLVYRRATKKK